LLQRQQEQIFAFSEVYDAATLSPIVLSRKTSIQRSGTVRANRDVPQFSPFFAMQNYLRENVQQHWAINWPKLIWTKRRWRDFDPVPLREAAT